MLLVSFLGSPYILLQTYRYTLLWHIYVYTNSMPLIISFQSLPPASNQHKHLHSISWERTSHGIPGAAGWLLAGSSSNKYNSTRKGWCPQKELNQLGFLQKLSKQTASSLPFFAGTLPETNIAPEIGLPKRKVVFQPSIFRAMLVSGRVITLVIKSFFHHWNV